VVLGHRRQGQPSTELRGPPNRTRTFRVHRVPQTGPPSATDQSSYHDIGLILLNYVLHSKCLTQFHNFLIERIYVFKLLAPVGLLILLV